MNTFEDKEKVTIHALTDIRKTATGFTVMLPACSVAEITIRG